MEGLTVNDFHVHLFPDKLFEAIWQWFEKYAWGIRYKLNSYQILNFLFSKGVHKITGLCYAHKPGISQNLNNFMLQICNQYPNVFGFATVFPGEPRASQILEEAFDHGLMGVKLHPHVQGITVDDEAIDEVGHICRRYQKPIIIHAGREPKTPKFNYNNDPYTICSVRKIEWLLKNFPGLHICVPHLGADEFDAYRKLLERYDSLWLDTSMTLGGFLHCTAPPPLSSFPLDRIIYGSDFPNIPYAWDRELKIIMQSGLNNQELVRILEQNGLRFMQINE